MTATAQCMAALESGNKLRSGRAQMRRDLRDGRLDLRKVLLDPPDLLAPLPIIDAVRLARDMSRTSAPDWFLRMGRDAVRDNINLLMPIGKASPRTREWVAGYADYRRHGRGAKPRVAA